MDQSKEHQTFALRLSLFYAAQFLVLGIHLPYLPVWLKWTGLSASEIAIITAAPFFVRLAVTPAAALYADAHNNHRRMVIGLASGALVAALLLSQMHGFWPLLIVAVLFALFMTTIMPLTETIAMRGVRFGGLDYGRMRLWGSLSFIAVGLVGGAALDAFGPGAGVWLLVAGTVVTVAMARQLPKDADTNVPATKTRPRLLTCDAKILVTSPVFLLFLVAAGALQASHATLYTFGAVHWRSQGIATVWVGVLWAVGVLAEVLLFAWSKRIEETVGAIRLLLAGGAAALSRWIVMSFDPSLAILLPLQILHGLTYGAVHLGAIHFIARAAPEGAAGTAQALYATMAMGVVMGAATLASGPLYDSYAGGAYLGAAVFAAVGFIAAVLLALRWDGRRLALPVAS